VVESNHTGFTGSGFVNLDNVTGSYVEWAVPSSSARQAGLTVRYANGTSLDRPMDVSVNGARVAAGHGFGATGAWTTWRETSLTVPLTAGTNTIRLTSAGPNGGPNLDRIVVS
jgi:endoglucanase